MALQVLVYKVETASWKSGEGVGAAATTTYGYDAFGSRVFQTTATTTTLYPFKWYSVASSTGSGATYAITTEYVFNGDTLLSTTVAQMGTGTFKSASMLYKRDYEIPEDIVRGRLLLCRPDYKINSFK